MPEFRATCGTSYDKVTAGRRTGEHLLEGKQCERDGSYENCRGLGLLLSAVNFVSN